MRRAIEAWGVWLALLLALSPVLQNLVEHWTADPWSRYSISFIVLLFVAARADSPGDPRPRLGLLLLVPAFAGQIFALTASVVAVGRPFAALAVLAMILLRGTTSLRTALLALWVVPLPAMVISALGGEAAVQGLYGAGTGLLKAVGMTFALDDQTVSAGANQLALAPHQSGLLLATHMSGLAWYSALRRGLPPGATARLIAGYALLALPIQFAAIVTSLMLLHCGLPGWIGRVADTATWLLPWMVVVAREWSRR